MYLFYISDVLVPCASLTQFRPNNVHKGGLKHHFIFSDLLLRIKTEEGKHHKKFAPNMEMNGDNTSCNKETPSDSICDEDDDVIPCDVERPGPSGL